MASDDEQYPGKLPAYRDYLDRAVAAEHDGEPTLAAAWSLAAEIAGLSQILDKIAYSARKAA